jgi:hypothetical protein
MAYKYYKIENFDPASRPYYFFDANVWIAILAGENTKKVQPYINFFESVISLNELEGAALKVLIKQKKHQPKIIMTSLLMSEIFNTYMRNVAMRQFYNSREVSTKNYKKDYRKTTDHEHQLKRLKANFLSYKNYFDLKNDKFGTTMTPLAVCNQLLSNADFNDFYYYYQLVDDNIPIVTEDGDFIFQDIEIITDNSALLRINSL